MAALEDLSSPCVCKRPFYWRRIFAPDVSKNDPLNWLVVFGGGFGDDRWENWCKILSSEQCPFDLKSYGVLLVTHELPEVQLSLSFYINRFNCATVRLLSDAPLRVGPTLSVAPENGIYPFTIVQMIGGKIVNRFT